MTAGGAISAQTAASSATTTRLAQGAFVGMQMDMVRWLAAVGADYGIIAVAQDSPFWTLPDLMDALTRPTRPRSRSPAAARSAAGIISKR